MQGCGDAESGLEAGEWSSARNVKSRFGRVERLSASVHSKCSQQGVHSKVFTARCSQRDVHSKVFRRLECKTNTGMKKGLSVFEAQMVAYSVLYQCFLADGNSQYTMHQVSTRFCYQVTAMFYYQVSTTFYCQVSTTFYCQVSTTFYYQVSTVPSSSHYSSIKSLQFHHQVTTVLSSHYSSIKSLQFYQVTTILSSHYSSIIKSLHFHHHSLQFHHHSQDFQAVEKLIHMKNQTATKANSWV